MIFNDLYADILKPSHQASNKYTDKQIREAINTHQGDNLPGFLSAGAFMSLMMPLMEKLRDPAADCLNEVHGSMESVAVALVNDSFARFPTLVDEISQSILDVIEKEKDIAKNLQNLIMDSECTYLYTKDPEYIQQIYAGFDPKARTKETSKSNDPNAQNTPGQDQNQDNSQQPRQTLNNAMPNQNQQPSNNDPQNQQDNTQQNQDQNNEQSNNKDKQANPEQQRKSKKEILKQLIHEIRQRINTYFGVNTKQMADMVPKVIGHYLIQNSLVSF